MALDLSIDQIWSYDVVHSIPGRFRVKSPLLKKNAAFAEGFADFFVRQRGITMVRVNQTCGSAAISYDPQVLHPSAALQILQNVSPARIRERPHRRRIEITNGNAFPFALSVAGFALSLLRWLPKTPVTMLLGLASIPIYRRAFQALRVKKPNVDVLDAAALTAIALRGDMIASTFMVSLINLGETMRDQTAQRSQRAMAELLSAHTDKAWVLRGQMRSHIPVEEILPDDIVVISTGEQIPVDGQVLSGEALIDQQALTGESVPIIRSIHDHVYACTLVRDGELMVRAEHVGEHTRAGRIIDVLRSAPEHGTRIEDYAARFADRLVLPTFLLAGGIFALTRNFLRALSIIIIDFGTGVRVASPTAILSSLTRSVQSNILIKGGRSIEKLASVDAVVFDKTGTLTTGHPEVVEIISLGHRSTEKILAYAAAAEAGLNHPAANAIVRHSEELGIPIPPRESFHYELGRGVRARIKGKWVLVGNKGLLDLYSSDGKEAVEIGIRLEAEGKSPIFVAVEGKLAGAIAYADPPRLESNRVVQGLKQRGIQEIHILTGDSKMAAQRICRGLDIENCLHGAFPEDKLRFIQDLKQKGMTVAVVGDGINDSPALAHADVAVSFRQGADIARETADVVLMDDDLSGLLSAIDLARDTMALIHQNMNLVAYPNAIGMLLAALGRLSPVHATLINNGSTILVGLNGLRPLLSRK